MWNWEGEAPAEPCVSPDPRLGRSLALPRIDIDCALTEIHDSILCDANAEAS